MPAAVEVADHGAVRTVTLSHPEKKNALTRAMLADLAQAARDVPNHVRVLILGGAGAVFSSGFYLPELDDGERARGINPIEPAAHALEHCVVPVIAAVQGVCMGGAVELCASCTFRFAHPETKVGIPAARFGLAYPEEGVARLVRRMSRRGATHLLLTADVVSGQRAAELGLFDTLVDDPDEAARAVAAQIAQNGPLAVRAMLLALTAHLRPGGPTDEERAAMIKNRGDVLASRDLREGLAAAAEKRSPRFEGA